jgi:hypothetical protein
MFAGFAASSRTLRQAQQALYKTVVNNTQTRLKMSMINKYLIKIKKND